MIGTTDFSRYEKSLIHNWANGIEEYQERPTDFPSLGQTLRATYGGDGVARRKLVSQLRFNPTSRHGLTGHQLYDVAHLLLSVEAGLDVTPQVTKLKFESEGHTDMQLRKLLFSQGLLEETHKVFQVRRYFESASPRVVPGLRVHKDGSSFSTNRISLVSGYRQSFLRLRQARVTGTGLILREDELWIGDPASDPVEEFVSGWWHLVVGHKSVPDKAAILVGQEHRQHLEVPSAVNGIFRNSANYWHQLIEYIPAISRAVKESGCKSVLWSTLAPENARKALNSICPGLEFIYVPPGMDAKVETLYLCSLTTSTWDSTLRPPVESCGYSAKSISSLYLNNSSIPPRSRSTFRNKKFVLIRESKNRRAINGNIFLSEAVKRGFEPLNLSRLDFDEQHDLFQNASVIAGFGGAEWANLVLANSEVKILNFVSESMSWFLGHRNIGHSLGVNMNTIVLRNMPTQNQSFLDSIHTPVLVKPGDFNYGFDLL